MIPCKFYAQGRCRYGQACIFRHEIPGDRIENLPGQTAAFPAFLPGAAADTLHDAHPIVSQTLDCRFFARGFCREGASCRFKHVTSTPIVNSSSPKNQKSENFEQQIRSVNIATTVGNFSNLKGGFLRNLGGAVVQFGSGGQVLHLEVSTITETINESAASARLQNHWVSCKWYKPSRIAWLHYEDSTTANRAVQILNAREIDGRKLECKLQEPDRDRHGSIISVQVCNLDVYTTSATLRRLLRGSCEAISIVIGKPSHDLSLQQAEDTVRKLLEDEAILVSWEVNEGFDPVRTKAIARFSTNEEACLASRKLNGMKVAALGNSKIFATLVVSVKFSMLTSMCIAMQAELDEFQRHTWETHKVRFKTYLPQPESQQAITVLRLYGEDSRSLAKAKSSLEAILAGSVAFHNGKPIWDPFYTTLDGLAFLKSIVHVHGGFVYLDLRMSRLRIYGTPGQKNAIHLRLAEQIAELHELTHTLILTPARLRLAVSGGFRRIVDLLGKQAAMLNIASEPKSITIRGSSHDFERACGFIMQEQGTKASSKKDDDDEVCAVCWTETTESLRTTCGHTYCRDCFASQCSSAPDGNIPVQCLGSAGDCKHIFSIAELADLLKPDDFEEFFQKAFAIHVRSHKELQYCPTPDCPNIYSVTSDGTVSTCAACLTAICTTCQAVSHYGITCEQYRELTSEGTRAFHQWKMENGVKDCPGCNMAIEKTFGCNHLECKVCGIHICWNCMETFTTGSDTYAHMEAVHGSF